MPLSDALCAFLVWLEEKYSQHQQGARGTLHIQTLLLRHHSVERYSGPPMEQVPLSPILDRWADYKWSQLSSAFTNEMGTIWRLKPGTWRMQGL